MAQFKLLRQLTLNTRLVMLSLVALLFGAPQAHSQGLSFTSPARTSPVLSTAGQSGRTGVGAAVFGPKLYLVYTGTGAADQYGNRPLQLITSTDGVNFTSPVSITVHNGGQTFVAASGANPSIVAFNNGLAIAFTNTSGGGSSFGNIITSPDASTWTLAPGLSTNSGGVSNSPSLAVLNGILYATAATDNGHVLFCKNQTLPSASCTEFVNNQTNFNPTLGVFNGKLFIIYCNYSNDHQIWYLSTSDGINFTTSSGLLPNSSSTPPTLFARNGYLYAGWRTNDGDHKFLWAYTSDGKSWVGVYEPGWTMGGDPFFYTLNLPSSPYNGALFNYFTSNDSSSTIYFSHGQ